MNKIFKNLLFLEILGLGVLGIIILYPKPSYATLLVADSNNIEWGESEANAPSDNTTDKEIEAFGTSKYNYWDARVLAEYWGQPTLEAKARMGRKILWGDEDVAYLEEILKDAQEKRLALINSSSPPYDFYADSGYTYDDAELLAQMWGYSVGEAKLWIESKLTMGDQDSIEYALTEARNKN